MDVSEGFQGLCKAHKLALPYQESSVALEGCELQEHSKFVHLVVMPRQKSAHLISGSFFTTIEFFEARRHVRSDPSSSSILAIVS